MITTAAEHPLRSSATSEALWNAELQRQRPWLPARGPLVIVAPYADDVALAAGGLLRSWAEVGYPARVLCVCEIAFASAASSAPLRSPRSALQILGGQHLECEMLGFDAATLESERPRLESMLQDRIAPGSTLIAPLESDGDPVHATVGRACRRIARQGNLTLARYPIRGWRRLKPTAFRGAAWGRFELHPRVLAVKRLAIRCLGAGADLDSFERPYEAFLL